MGKVDLPWGVSWPDCPTKALLPLPQQLQSSYGAGMKMAVCVLFPGFFIAVNLCPWHHTAAGVGEW